jgi:hypothetical protein
MDRARVRRQARSSRRPGLALAIVTVLPVIAKATRSPAFSPSARRTAAAIVVWCFVVNRVTVCIGKALA